MYFGAVNLQIIKNFSFKEFYKTKMNGFGDSVFEYKRKSKDESIEDIYARHDVEVKPLVSQQQRYKKNLLTNATKYHTFLEKQSLIDCLETDEEYIVSAGRDHDINVWAEDVSEGEHVHRLSGHHAPVTGLSVFNSGHSKFDKIIISSSEDGSIRVWSLNRGEELHKIETGNVITCLGIMNKSLAIIGNHKGYMEVYHLRSGDLYSSIRAHVDPIDALEVDGNYACTATFEDPPCLKVWDIQFEQTRCIYRLEYSPHIEFCCMAMWNMKCVLGSSTEQKLCVIDFKNDSVDSINLDRPGGKIERVKVWNEWIISCSSHKNEVLLDVLRFHKYEHFGTVLCQVKQIRAIAAIELNSSLKIVLGGSGLEMLNFNFNLPDEETDIPDSRFPVTVEKTSLAENKENNNRATKQEDDSESDTLLNCGQKVTLQSNNENKYFKQEDITGPVSLLHKFGSFSSNCKENSASTQQSSFDRCHHVNYENENNGDKISILILVQKEACLSPSARTSPMQDTCEPGVAMTKLKEEFDKYKRQKEIENFAKSDNNVEKENIFSVNFKYSKFELDIKYLNSKKKTKECKKDKKKEASVLIMVKSEEVIVVFKSSDKITYEWKKDKKTKISDFVIINNITNTYSNIGIMKDSEFEIIVKGKRSEKETKECEKDKKKQSSVLTIVKSEDLKIEYKSSKKITKESKKDKKKESQKSKHGKCQIM